MSPKFEEVQCPHCSRMIRSTDKFCIFCGNRIESKDASKAKKASRKNDPEQEEIEKEVNSDLGIDTWGLNAKKDKDDLDDENLPFLLKESSADKLDDRVIASVEKERAILESIELPESIKEQLEVKMKLAAIEQKKRKLRIKLKELTSSLDDDRYEWDVEYAKTINLKLNAFKTIKEELEEEEEVLRGDLGSEFRVDVLEENIDVKREQLIELKRSFKHHKMKKDVYEQLKDEYSEAFLSAQNELSELRVNLIRWLSKEKAEINRVEGRIRLLKGRYKSKEIDQETYDEQKADLEKKIETITQRVKILEGYARDRKKKWFK